MVDLSIIGGTVVSAQGETQGDVAISDGRIVAVGDGVAAGARHVIDAAGCYVLPGLIDAHVHFREPGMAHKEGVENGTIAAALGGVTTTIITPTDDPMTAGPWSSRRSSPSASSPWWISPSMGSSGRI